MIFLMKVYKQGFNINTLFNLELQKKATISLREDTEYDKERVERWLFKK